MSITLPNAPINNIYLVISKPFPSPWPTFPFTLACMHVCACTHTHTHTHPRHTLLGSGSRHTVETVKAMTGLFPRCDEHINHQRGEGKKSEFLWFLSLHLQLIRSHGFSVIGPAGSFNSVVDDKEKMLSYWNSYTRYPILVHGMYAACNHMESFFKTGKSSSFNFV